MKYFKLGRSVLATLLLAFLIVPVAAQAQSVDILKIYNDCSNQTNLDESIKCFTDDAVFVDPGGSVQGKEAIRAKFMTNANAGPTKYSIQPHVEGNKVLCRQLVAVPGQNITLDVDFTFEFQGDKIKKVTVAPTPESLQKLAALQGAAPGLPNSGAGGAAVTREDNTLLIVALIASGVVIIAAAGVGLMMNRRTVRR